MYQNKKIVILGLARSGYEIAKLLKQRNNEVILTDQKEEKDHDINKINELRKLGVTLYLGENPRNLITDDIDLLIKNPGVAIDHFYVLEARKRNIPVVNELEVSFEIIKNEHNSKFIAITGTNGKTTTTTLIYEILNKFLKNVKLAGNIGYPLAAFVKESTKDDIFVVEVSCQQLENISKFHPDIAVMTNISEAHLEFMKTFDHYKEVKSRITKNQTEDDLLIINETDDVLQAIGLMSKARKKMFSKNHQTTCYLKDDAIYYNNEKIIDCNRIRLVGVHNYENIMAAIIVAKEFGVPNEIINEVLITFKGVTHRLEFVKEVNKVSFYNDTEATNIKCSQIALSSFNQNTRIILGGYERGQDFNLLLPYMKNVVKIYAIGQCQDRVVAFANKNNIPVSKCTTLKASMDLIKQEMQENEIVLLSPASASWDQYKQCEDRGDEFKQLI